MVSLLLLPAAALGAMRRSGSFSCRAFLDFTLSISFHQIVRCISIVAPK